MQAPLRTRPVRDRRFEWSVNEDPALLDRMYVRLLGDGGDQMLSDEVKWLAVTHKSFDQGRRGYNDRLAFLGRRIVTLQASLALMESSARSGHPNQGSPDGPFAHPALSGLSGLTEDSLMGVSKSRLARLAARTGLPDVVRWLPRRPDNLGGSGEPTVLVEALFAIVGAVALQKGGPAAEKVARERILEPLGLGSGA
ncbi:MAG: hypothetical protein M1832_002793 [Thelocarpon impressellum]|nr:MAG: hypothetical protein M1832_002793 [Thelocarpon impressellum]